MKLKNYFLGTLLCLSFSLMVAAEEHDRTMALSISPVALIVGSADLLYQVRLIDSLALTVPVVFGYNWPLATIVGFYDKATSGKIKTTKAPLSIEGGLGLRYTPFSRVMHDSFFLEPRLTVKYQQFGASYEAEKLEWQKVDLTPALHLGYDWYWDSGFLISLGGSIGYAVSLQQGTRDVPKELIDHLKLASHIWPGKIPGAQHYWMYDLEFKLGYSW